VSTDSSNIQHPSRELLKKNGFIQYNYDMWHDNCVKGTYTTHTPPLTTRHTIVVVVLQSRFNCSNTFIGHSHIS
jgi:hypothetical protein